MEASEIKWLEACPKCGVASSVFRKIEIEDKRNLYLEVHASCPKCWFVWREFYERGVFVKWVDMTPKPKSKPEPIKVVKTCPYCGKYCDSTNGISYDFESFRIRHYAHRECSKRVGGFAPTPFGPPYEKAN